MLIAISFLQKVIHNSSCKIHYRSARRSRANPVSFNSAVILLYNYMRHFLKTHKRGCLYPVVENPDDTIFFEKLEAVPFFILQTRRGGFRVP